MYEVSCFKAVAEIFGSKQFSIQSLLSNFSSEKALNACLDSIQEALSDGGKMSLYGFGTFSVENRKARKGRNPQTGEEITIPESKVVKFRPGKNLREVV